MMIVIGYIFGLTVGLWLIVVVIAQVLSPGNIIQEINQKGLGRRDVEFERERKEQLKRLSAQLNHDHPFYTRWLWMFRTSSLLLEFSERQLLLHELSETTSVTSLMVPCFFYF